MIEQITGKVIDSSEKTITVLTGGIGVLLITPQPQKIHTESTITLFCHLHWSQDRGPSLFGFTKKLERKLFLMLIECHKIGPQIALQILSQIEAETCLQILAQGQERELSNLNGIGAKKSKQLVSELQEKASKLLATSNTDVACDQAASSASLYLHDVSQALKSLGYSLQESSEAIRAATKNGASSFDQVMRTSLSYLSKMKGL